MCDKYVCKYDSHLRARQMCYKYSANVIPVYKHVNVYGCFIFTCAAPCSKSNFSSSEECPSCTHVPV